MVHKTYTAHVWRRKNRNFTVANAVMAKEAKEAEKAEKAEEAKEAKEA